MQKWIKKLWWVLPVMLILAGLIFVLWASAAAEPMPEALAALESDDRVQVEVESITNGKENETTPQRAGCLKSAVGVGLGLTLGALAGIIVGLLLGVGIAMILGVL